MLEAHRDVFEDWRYAYEHDALYTWLPQFDGALEAIIETYNPPPVVQIGSLGNMAR